jgi:hypothetical protein
VATSISPRICPCNEEDCRNGRWWIDLLALFVLFVLPATRASCIGKRGEVRGGHTQLLTDFSFGNLVYFMRIQSFFGFSGALGDHIATSRIAPPFLSFSLGVCRPVDGHPNLKVL